MRGYTDTTEGIYFQYPYGWGESYTLGSDDGSMTTGLSDEPGVQSLYVDVHAGADPLAALESELEKAGTGDSEITEATFGGLPAYMAQYMVTTDDGAASAVVFSVPNESGGSAMIFSFAACGQGAAPDRVVVDLVDSTLAFFAPLGN